MTLKTKLLPAAAVLACLALATIVHAAAGPEAAVLTKDQAGATDSDLTGRYKDATLLLQTHKAFDEINLPAGAAVGEEYDSKKHFAKEQAVQGDILRTVYVSPTGRSTLEVLKNHRDALIAKGFAPVFECAGAACGPSFRKQKYAWDNPKSQVAALGIDHARQGYVQAVFDAGKDVRYSLLRKGDAYAALFAALNAGGGYGSVSEALNDRVSILIEIAQPKAMDRNIVVVDASAIGQALATEGQIALYGLYFDTDKATLMPTSKPQLDQMGKFLKANPAVQVYVVGHTDNQGGLDHNMALADARAKSVAAALTSGYAVPAASLVARGVGPLAPVSTNRTDAGRAKNRRVVLVLR
jgi:OOP family OmpA-OmpF porin